MLWSGGGDYFGGCPGSGVLGRSRMVLVAPDGWSYAVGGTKIHLTNASPDLELPEILASLPPSLRSYGGTGAALRVKVMWNGIGFYGFCDELPKFSRSPTASTASIRKITSLIIK